MLPQNEYDHFMQICVAVRICSSNTYKHFIPIATKLFKLYVENYIILYGRHTIGSNVHNLIHITEDMQRSGIGNLMDISTYKYENCLRLLTLKIKHSNLPLEQVVRRIIEREMIDDSFLRSNLFDPPPFIPKIFYEKRHRNQLVYSKIELAPDVYLSSRSFNFENPDPDFKGNDSWFLTKSNEIVKMLYAQKDGINFKVHGLRIIKKEPFFENSTDSTVLDIFQSDGKLESKMCVYDINLIKAKMICLTNTHGVTVFIPLLHTLECLNK